MKIPKWSLAAGLVVLFLALPSLASKDRTALAGQGAQETDPIEGPIVGDPVVPGLSPAVRDLPAAKVGPLRTVPVATPSRPNPTRDDAAHGIGSMCPWTL